MSAGATPGCCRHHRYHGIPSERDPQCGPGELRADQGGELGLTVASGPVVSSSQVDQLSGAASSLRRLLLGSVLRQGRPVVFVVLAQTTCLPSDVASPCVCGELSPGHTGHQGPPRSTQEPTVQDSCPHLNTRLGKGIRYTLENCCPGKGHLIQAGRVEAWCWSGKASWKKRYLI